MRHLRLVIVVGAVLGSGSAFGQVWFTSRAAYDSTVGVPNVIGEANFDALSLGDFSASGVTEGGMTFRAVSSRGNYLYVEPASPYGFGTGNVLFSDFTGNNSRFVVSLSPTAKAFGVEVGAGAFVNNQPRPQDNSFVMRYTDVGGSVFSRSFGGNGFAGFSHTSVVTQVEIIGDVSSATVTLLDNAVQSVPEPMTMSVLGFGALGLWVRRRRRAG